MSDGPVRDLRRGLLRSVPFAALVNLLILSGDLYLVIAVVTACFAWVPLTMLEGGVRRRRHGSVSTRWLVGVVMLTWLVIAGVVLGCTLQYHYLYGLSRGLGPVEALQTIQSGWWLVGVVALVACVGVVASTCTTARATVRDPTQPPMVLWKVAAGQILVLACAMAIQFGRAGDSVVSGFVLIWIVLPVTGLPLFGLVVWPLTSTTDRLEARWWPPDHVRNNDGGPR